MLRFAPALSCWLSQEHVFLTPTVQASGGKLHLNVRRQHPPFHFDQANASPTPPNAARPPRTRPYLLPREVRCPLCVPLLLCSLQPRTPPHAANFTTHATWTGTIVPVPCLWRPMRATLPMERVMRRVVPLPMGRCEGRCK